MWIKDVENTFTIQYKPESTIGIYIAQQGGSFEEISSIDEVEPGLAVITHTFDKSGKYILKIVDNTYNVAKYYMVEVFDKSFEDRITDTVWNKKVVL